MRTNVTVLLLLPLFISSVGWTNGPEGGLRPAGIFGDHMVLQQGQELPFWGWAIPGSEVTVTMKGQSRSVQAGEDGRWLLKMPALPASSQPMEVQIRGGEEKLVFHDVLVGEVWLCSGQSNMGVQVKTAANAEAEIASANDPALRVFGVPGTVSPVPLDNVSGAWGSTTSGTVGNFSAVAYYFAKNLRQDMNVPFGLIIAAKGNTPAEGFVDPETVQTDPRLQYARNTLAAIHRMYPSYQSDFADFEKSFNGEGKKAFSTYMAWGRENLEAARASKPLTPEPVLPLGPGVVMPWSVRHIPSTVYNGMIHPLIPYAIRGALWYQGEGNTHYAVGHYDGVQSAMTSGWRRLWGQGDFPFLFVQLANYYAKSDLPTAYARLREKQTIIRDTCPNTAMAVAIDIGDENNIHAKNKQDVGKRLALCARATVYGEENVVYRGPRFRSMEKLGDGRVRLHFDHIERGLRTRDDASATGFTVGGKDQAFHPATAKIDGDTVVVACPEVPEPVAVRYGWEHNPVCNLQNAAGLPAEPFRTDD